MPSLTRRLLSARQDAQRKDREQRRRRIAESAARIDAACAAAKAMLERGESGMVTIEITPTGYSFPKAWTAEGGNVIGGDGAP